MTEKISSEEPKSEQEMKGSSRRSFFKKIILGALGVSMGFGLESCSDGFDPKTGQWDQEFLEKEKEKYQNELVYIKLEKFQKILEKAINAGDRRVEVDNGQGHRDEEFLMFRLDTTDNGKFIRIDFSQDQESNDKHKKYEQTIFTNKHGFLILYSDGTLHFLALFDNQEDFQEFISKKEGYFQKRFYELYDGEHGPGRTFGFFEGGLLKKAYKYSFVRGFADPHYSIHKENPIYEGSKDIDYRYVKDRTEEIIDKLNLFLKREEEKKE